MWMELAAIYQDWGIILVSLKASILLWFQSVESWALAILTIPRLLPLSNVPTHPSILQPQIVKANSI